VCQTERHVLVNTYRSLQRRLSHKEWLHKAHAITDDTERAFSRSSLRVADERLYTQKQTLRIYTEPPAQKMHAHVYKSYSYTCMQLQVYTCPESSTPTPAASACLRETAACPQRSESSAELRTARSAGVGPCSCGKATVGPHAASNERVMPIINEACFISGFCVLMAGTYSRHSLQSRVCLSIWGV